ncbi:MAG: membrane protein insertase YidC [Phycisphaerae bacterium]
MDTRRLFLYIAVAAAVFFVYRAVYDRLSPPPPPRKAPYPAATQPATGPAVRDTWAAADERPATRRAPTTTPTGPAADFAFTAAPEVETFALGGGPDDQLRVNLTSRGAAVETIKLTGRKKDGKYVHRKDAETNEPYVLLRPVEGPHGPYASYLTRQIWLGDSAWPLSDLVWEVAEKSGHGAAFTTTLRSGEGAKDRLRVTKTYTLEPDSPLMRLRLKVENLGNEPFELKLEQNGPVGIPKENTQYDMRKLVRARREEQKVQIEADARGDLKDGKRLGSSAEQFVWTALANKYFAVFTRPLAREDGVIDYVHEVVGSVVIPNLMTAADPGDYLARILTTPQNIAPGSAVGYAFEIYAGTKNADDLEKANPAYADRRQIGYVAARDADTRCCAFCTFPFLTSFMTGLLETIQVVVRNYGVAIIILVLIIRVLLHPLAVFQQKSMYRMQEAQARLQPKLNALKEKYASDKVKLNQETMKLYGEEGVNPMAGMVGMLPMMIQMPILIALWTALNTDVHLRHAGFDPWWITDLSAPDGLIEFAKPITIPILGWLPLIGSWFTNIPSLNLLPVLMGVSMWLQQKYMPKPGMQAKLEAARKAAAEKKTHQKRSGMSPEEQARQQQMIMHMMSIMFPIMLYYMPSGLNLYWMSTNVFGIAESLRIRKQLQAEKERREREGPQPPVKKKPGVVGRIFKHLAAQAEGLQKRADQLSKEEAKQQAAKRARTPSRRR